MEQTKVIGLGWAEPVGKAVEKADQGCRREAPMKTERRGPRSEKCGVLCSLRS